MRADASSATTVRTLNVNAGRPRRIMPVKHSNENQSRLKADFFNTIGQSRRIGAAFFFVHLALNSDGSRLRDAVRFVAGSSHDPSIAVQ
jgi:hypothetical protein